MRIDKILTIPIPYWFLLIDSIPYRFDSLSILLSILILTSAEVEKPMWAAQAYNSYL